VFDVADVPKSSPSVTKNIAASAAALRGIVAFAKKWSDQGFGWLWLSQSSVAASGVRDTLVVA